ncbi:ribosomal L1 domain-containing protein CG13096-like [Papaver somniferum]|uniref:ribosomal L1 domain-containing protein CG13096-like n=1 Tax=Papaver somniferum TaxID=3469 RepID=UPI000E6F9518|nr:ribosomal L1 domain-containing protein CG13096-like [Papaver somniferum]
MATSSNSDYDYDYSSSSSDEYSKVPEVKISAAESRAKMDQSLKKAKEVINGMSLDQLKTACDRFSKRIAEDEIVAEYRGKRLQIQRRRLAAKEKLLSRPDGVASDSDAEEEEPVWEPREHKVKPHPLTREIEQLVEADLKAEREKEEYWDAMYSNPDEKEDFGEDSNSDSEEELEEDPMEDDDGDDESDESDD